MKSRNFISILIPVYKEPELLDDIIDKYLVCFIFEKTLIKPVVLAIDWKS
jgi:hypothetical protein